MVSLRRSIMQNKHVFVCFIESNPPLEKDVQTAYKNIISTLSNECLQILIIEDKGHIDICDEMKVETPTTLIFEEGKEIARYTGASPDQLEYLVSKNLCGMSLGEGLML
ncbi:hypothetical protein N7513_001757 [Penicillium frequentans]|nr:hypothetical protein N7513_001757 [Penicillium glabrum]